MHDSIGPRRIGRSRRTSALAAAVVAAIGLAACGGGSHAPHVASIATTTSTDGGQSVPAVQTKSGAHHRAKARSAKGDPTVLLNEWASCMRGHGDPGQADPTVDAYGVINVTIPSDAPQSMSGEVHAGADPCNHYMAAAQSALRAANPVAPPPSQTDLLRYVVCMRSNGVPKYPYPSGNTTNFNGTGVNPSSPSVMRVNRLCGRKLNLPGWWIAGNGPPGDVVVGNNGPTPNPGQAAPSNRPGNLTVNHGGSGSSG